MSESEFLKECRRGSGKFDAEMLESGVVEDGDTDAEGFRTVHYEADLVKKAIHLYRNPFHNIVSRFHLERKHWVESNKKYEVNRYPNNSTGFQKWCKDLNKQYGPKPGSNSTILEPDVVKLMQKVPCHGEMYKYIQWHNLAHAVTLHSRQPTLVLHYENYDKKWNQTATRILDFLHLELEGEKKAFSARHDYAPYFSQKQREATKLLLERLATKPVWRRVERYFRR